MASFTVTTTADTTGATDGVLSLREAIAQANTAAGDDTITFADALAGKTIVLTQGELVIDNQAGGDDGSLTVNGDLANGDVTISGNDTSRVLHIVGDSADEVQVVELNSLTLTHGSETAGHGGGVLAENADVTVVASTVFDNVGAGIASLGGDLSLRASTIAANADSGYAAAGIYKQDGTLSVAECAIGQNHVSGILSNNAIVTLTDSILSGNDGSGAYLRGGSLTADDTIISNNAGAGVSARATAVTITACLVARNQGSGINAYESIVSVEQSDVVDNFSSGGGGGIAAGYGTLTIENSTVSGNYSDGYGGGVSMSGGTMSIVASTISGNRSGGVGTYEGDYHSGAGGGIFCSDAEVAIANSTINENYARYPGDGGGIRASGGSVAISGSSIHDNSAGTGGGISTDGVAVSLANTTVADNRVGGSYGSDGSGGGMRASGGSLTIDNCTISANSVSGLANYAPGTNQPAYFVRGGGLALIDVVPAIGNSIIAGNSNADGSPYGGSSGANPLLADITGSIASNGHNLFGQSIIDGATTGDLVGVSDPRLGALADNGGPSWTLALLGGSPAIDAGLDTDADGLESDQRGDGFGRVNHSHVDIGAFELQQLPIGKLFTTNADTVDLNDFQLINYHEADASTALGGNDTVQLSNAQNLGIAFHGGGGDDTITGGSAGDRIFGDAGDDVVVASGGTDTFDGGTGDDTVRAIGSDLSGITLFDVENLADSATLSAAQMNAFAKIGSDTPRAAGTYAYNLTDASEAIDLAGRVEAEDSFAVHGSGSDDRVAMGAESLGSDALFGNDGDDVLDSSGGNDAIYGGSGKDQIGGGSGHDYLIGDDGDDLLDGTDAGDDYLEGSAGDDILAAGQGSDALYGGDGADRFTLRPGGAGIDRLWDFTPGVDHLHIGDGLDEATLIATALVTDGGSTVLTLGTEDFVIVRNATGISADWFA